MKELSIKEKARRYDEALERAKELLEVGLKDTRDKRVVLSFFPELAESEDERIRKELICFLETEIPQCNARDKYIAWLEKQGEQKSTDKVELMPTWSKEDERDFDVIYGIIYNSCNAEDASRLLTWFKAIKDRVQPKQEWSNWDKTIIESIEALCDEKIESVVFQDVKEHVNDIKDWLKSLRPQSQWKLSEEQMNNK